MRQFADMIDNRLQDCKGGPLQPRAPTPFETADQVLDEARTLCVRVESLVNRMVGPPPDMKCDSDKGGGPLHGSLLAKLEGTSFETSAAIRRAHGALERLEGSLP